MTVKLSRYIYNRKGFKVVCDETDSGQWTGVVEFEDGQRIVMDGTRVTHGAVFSWAKEMHRQKTCNIAQ